MKITKFGHCCLLIEENGLRILTDPGSYTTEQNNIKDIQVILITHDHPDHLHLDSLKEVLANNPDAQVVTNNAVGTVLGNEGVTYTLLGDRESQSIQDVLIEAYEAPHAELHPTIPQILNTGFFIANKLFYPGDAFIKPEKPIDTLALPIIGPWTKSSEVVDYAMAIKPKQCFPVHDGMLKEIGPYHRFTDTFLSKDGIKFFIPENNVGFEI